MEQRRLRRCARCAELKGEGLVEDRYEGIVRVPVICICKGVPCPQCGKRLIRRPISNNYDERAGTVWHTPWFGYLTRCTTCRTSPDSVRSTEPSSHNPNIASKRE